MALTPPPQHHGDLARRVQIVNELGLHARAAAKLAAVAGNAKGAVRVHSGQQQADATDILDILGLGACPGTWITIEVAEPTDGAVLARLVELVESGFGE